MPEVRLSYQPPTAGAHQVGVAGDFTNWEILDMLDVGGIYVFPINLESGKYIYKFIIDGVWSTDPGNPMEEADPFGGCNSVLLVSPQKKHEYRWNEIWKDQASLLERAGNYLNLNRMEHDEFEVRFNWYPSLPANISIELDGVSVPLYRLGTESNKDVYHCTFKSELPIARILVCIAGPEGLLYLGAHGFSKSKDDNRVWEINLSSLLLFDVPNWVHDGVIYQIFPDRFCNGDSSLNPDFHEWYYADCKTPPAQGEILQKHQEYFHFVQNWKDINGLQQSPWLPEGNPDWWSFYGGDLPGITGKLDYLSDLGVSILYFNPLWQGKSNHKYDAADFKSIDSHFGSFSDMQKLVAEAHQRGMKLIVDVAFNHTGETFWAFRDCVDKGEKSAYWNWYDWKKWPLPQSLPGDFDPREYYQCWWGIKNMPDLNFDLSRPHPAENYIRDITKAEPNRALVEYLLDCVDWWLLEVGIDGFRLDVPDEVPFWFWELFRNHVKRVKPNAWIVGEIWYGAQNWVGARYFDSVMNYAYFKNPVLEFFVLGISDKNKFCATIEAGLALYTLQSTRAMMNLLGSHDTMRIMQLAEGEIAKVKLAVLFQMTFVGTPHIYYGDEIATWGAKDPDNRRPFDWDWEQNPSSRELRSLYKELIQLRKDSALLRNGEFAFLELEQDVLAYTRYDSNEVVNIVMNLEEGVLTYPITSNPQLLFVLGDVALDGVQFRLAPHSAVVYRPVHEVPET